MAKYPDWRALVVLPSHVRMYDTMMRMFAMYNAIYDAKPLQCKLLPKSATGHIFFANLGPHSDFEKVRGLQFGEVWASVDVPLNVLDKLPELLRSPGTFPDSAVADGVYLFNG